MLAHILEISKEVSKGGRVPIKIALLKIHEDEKETNRNGIHWKEEYVRNAIDSVKMMPLCASFIDEDKTVPLDHGLTGEIVNKDGIREPVFENSETVGCFESAKIENVIVNGNEIKALTSEGFLYSQRYPSFVSWVRENYAKGTVDTSIEIMGLEINNNNIIYEEENPTDKFRTPKEFQFSASCILSVRPADADAIVLEVAQEKETKKEEHKKMEEKDLKEFRELIQTTISESNSKNDELNTKITELNSQITEKDNTISELNASVEQLQAVIDQMKKDQETYWEEREILEKELARAKVDEKLAELDSALSEFNEDEKKCAEDEINKLKADLNACKKEDNACGNKEEDNACKKELDACKKELNNATSEINSIVNKICRNIVANKKKAESEAKIAEQNAVKEQKETEVVDIFSEMCTETQTDDDISIF